MPPVRLMNGRTNVIVIGPRQWPEGAPDNRSVLASRARCTKARCRHCFRYSTASAGGMLSTLSKAVAIACGS